MGNSGAVTIGPLTSLGRCEYLVTHDAIDSFGNHAEQVSRLVQVLDKTAPVITCPGNLVIEPAEPRGATLSFNPAVTDVCDNAPEVTFFPSLDSFFEIGNRTNVTCTAKDASGNVAECSFTARVLTVTNVLSNRISDVSALRDAGALKRKVANTILDYLQDARRLHRRGEDAAACVELQDLIAYVNKQIGTGKLDPLYGEPVLSSAYRLRKTLDCN